MLVYIWFFILRKLYLPTTLPNPKKLVKLFLFLFSPCEFFIEKVKVKPAFFLLLALNTPQKAFFERIPIEMNWPLEYKPALVV